MKVVGGVVLWCWRRYSFALEAIFLGQVGVFNGLDVLFQWIGTRSAGLTRAPGGRRFEGDQQLERTRASVVMNNNEAHHSASPADPGVKDLAGSRTVRRIAAVCPTVETQCPLADGVSGASKRTIRGMQMRMLTTGHDPTAVGARAARDTTANAAAGEGGRITEGGCSAVPPPRLPALHASCIQRCYGLRRCAAAR